MMTIVTRYDPPPIPVRKFDWIAFDQDTYDPESLCPIGRGATEADAIADFLEQIND